MIPKTIWMTYKLKFEELPDYISNVIDTWKFFNPEWEIRYNTDEDMHSFVKKEFPEYYEIYNMCPKIVMKGDLWRYMILYKYGGVYADIDAVCNTPIEDWLKEDSDMIVAPEHVTPFLCQWTMAAAPGHPALKCVLDLAVERFKDLDLTRKDPVLYYTGPHLWTSGILKYYNKEVPLHFIPNIQSHQKNLIDMMSKIQDQIKKCINTSSLKPSIYCHETPIFHTDKVYHCFGGDLWKQKGYVGWKKEDS